MTLMRITTRHGNTFIGTPMAGKILGTFGFRLRATGMELSFKPADITTAEWVAE